ncbi:MAG: hypothetical protein ACFFDH_08400 [Promethearchaeota archaeon]
MQKDVLKKEEIIGSETIFEKIRDKTPWIFGNSLRKPKIHFPKLKLSRLSLPTPSRSLSVITTLIILFVLQSGVVYFMIRDPPSIGANSQGQPIFIYTDLHESFIIEGIVASILILFCSIGFIALYQASKYVYNKKMAMWVLVIGIVMIIISFVILQYMINVKIGEIKI